MRTLVGEEVSAIDKILKTVVPMCKKIIFKLLKLLPTLAKAIETMLGSAVCGKHYLGDGNFHNLTSLYTHPVLVDMAE